MESHFVATYIYNAVMQEIFPVLAGWACERLGRLIANNSGIGLLDLMEFETVLR
jgi:hypothetical protein